MGTNYEDLEWKYSRVLEYYEAIVKADARASQNNIDEIFKKYREHKVWQLFDEELADEIKELQSEIKERTRGDKETWNEKRPIKNLKIEMQNFMENRRRVEE